MENVRVRFAPSPTGPLHIGGARSALFNWLLARRFNGQMIVRIEDTDLERSSRESEENILESLRWLGIDWDEGIQVNGDNGPYRQTERLHLYSEVVDKLLASGQAYYCYCTQEELEAEREVLMAKGELPRYMGKCRDLTLEQRQAFEAEGRKPVIRFRVPSKQVIEIDDLVRGKVRFESEGIGDYIIVKSDGIPTYNFAVVIDDHLMNITYVIRGEEHLSNTPRQILLYEALGYNKPKFAHVSLILGKDRTKMSKRHGSTAVEQYKAKGYLPEALVNFLVLLGWSPEGEEEIFTLEQLVNMFSLDRVAKNPAVFDNEKLEWINGCYIRQADLKRITDLSIPYLVEAGLIEQELTEERYQWVTLMVKAVRDRISYLAQITEHVSIFFGKKVEFENEQVKEVLQTDTIDTVMAAFKTNLLALEELNAENVKKMLKTLMKELQIGGKHVYMPIRVALTGQQHGPELFDIIPILGKELCLSRINNAFSQL